MKLSYIIIILLVFSIYGGLYPQDDISFDDIRRANIDRQDRESGKKPASPGTFGVYIGGGAQTHLNNALDVVGDIFFMDKQGDKITLFHNYYGIDIAYSVKSERQTVIEGYYAQAVAFSFTPSFLVLGLEGTLIGSIKTNTEFGFGLGLGVIYSVSLNEHVAWHLKCRGGIDMFSGNSQRIIPRIALISGFGFR